MNKTKFFHARPIFYCFLTLLLSISTTKFVFEGNIFYIIFDVAILFVFALFCVFNRRFISLILIFCTFLVGFGWYFVGISTFSGKDYKQPVNVIGRISDDYFETSKYISCTLDNVYIDGKKEKDISLTINLSSQSEENPQIGDVIVFTGSVLKAKLFELGEFNSFYYRDRTPYCCTIGLDDITVRASQQLKTVEKFRLKVKDILYLAQGEKDGTISYAILFGDKSEIDVSVKDNYKLSGIIHILTVSGLHISFLFGLLAFILKKLKIKNWLNLILCLIFLALYFYACDFAPSVLRAGIMGLVLVFSKISGKCYDGLNSLGFAGILILLVFPLFALDVGFLMSCFCVLSIFVLFPIFSKILKHIFPKFIAESFAISIGVEITIFPMLAMMNSTFNLLTVFVNLLVIPIFSIVYPLLFISVLLCLGMPFLIFLLKASAFGLDAINFFAEFFATTSFVYSLKPIDIFCLAAGYSGLFLLGKNFMASKKVRAICCCSLFSLSGLFFGLSFLPAPLESSIVCGYKYNQPLVMLTNSQNNTVCVDLAGNMDKAMQRLRLKSVAAAFVLQNENYDFEFSRDLNVKCVVRSDSGSGFSEEIENAKQGTIAGFNYDYIFYNSSLLGLEINFDNNNIFILKDNKISNSALDMLSEKDYNVVLLGRQSDYAQNFAKSYVVTYYDCENSNSSYQKDGNVQILLKNLKRRVLD